MSFYYAQEVYQKNQLGTRLDKRPDIIPGVNIINRKASVAIINRAGGSGDVPSSSAGVFFRL